MNERRPTFTHRIEYALFESAVAVSTAIGERGSDGLGAALGRLGYAPLRVRRAVAEKNLRSAFPDRDEQWIRDTMRAAYAHLGREALATIRLARMTREQVIARTEMHGLDAFRAALAKGRGAVLASGHVGNHEIAAASLAARGVALDIVVQQQGNPLFNAALNRARRRMGVGIIDRFQAHRLAVKALRAGRSVAFAADQNAGKSGVFVPFFGRLASTHRGPAVFAIKARAPLFLGTCVRKGNGYESRIQPVEVDRTGPLDEAVFRLTSAFTACLEEVVRSAPDQYLWLHRRWKTRPPAPPPGT